jgi:arabinan endo-1,5-alpha-L-arabinosidase
MRRHLKSLLPLSLLAAAVVAGIALGQTPATPSAAAAKPAGAPDAATPQEFARKMGMRTPGVHDPSTIVKCGDQFYVYATGMSMFHSPDLVNWQPGPSPITQQLSWTAQAVPGRANTNPGAFWAPDVIKVKDKYLLFMALSAFGVNTSGIGVMSSPTLDPTDPNYKWTDNGLVVMSKTTDDFNCIDPAALYDTDGKLWLSFGSFWSGIKLIELNPDTGRRIAPDSPMVSIAHWDSIEASYLYKHGQHYYLFVDFGMCCRQANSTYNMRIGRADKITGPYLDKDGKDMLTGGGSPFMDSHLGPLIGPGHAGIVQMGDKYYLSFHVESNSVGRGSPNGGTLGVRPITWNTDGWPVLQDAE